MIEKLSEYEITSRDGDFINADCNTKIINTLVRKINELVDAVNALIKENNIHEKQIDELQMKVESEKCETPAKNVQDKFAEQRKWIGCLVEYGDADDGFRYGILTNIEPIFSAYPFEIDNGRDAAADCWLPSKTIFYKGE